MCERGAGAHKLQALRQGLLARAAFASGYLLAGTAWGCFRFAVQNRLTRIETAAIIFLK